MENLNKATERFHLENPTMTPEKNCGVISLTCLNDRADSEHEAKGIRMIDAVRWRYLAMTVRVAVATFCIGDAAFQPTLNAQAFRTDTARDAVIRVETKPNIDEKLFLVRALEGFYESLYLLQVDSGSFIDEVDSVRQDAKRHIAYIRENAIDSSIAEMYADFVNVLDTYEKSLIQIVKASGRAESRKDDALTRNVTKSSFVAGEMAGGALASGADLGTAVGIWAVGTLMDYFLNTEDESGAIEDAKMAEIRDIVTRYQNVTETAVSKVRSQCKTLAGSRGWQDGEPGFEDNPKFAESLAKSIASGDYPELLRLRNIECRKRPRDPFAVWSRALAIIFKNEATPAEANEKAEECFEAASLVPAGRFYDLYRKDFIESAAVLATASAQLELGEGGWVSAPVRSAERAVRFCRTVLHYDELDESGAGRAHLAWALAAQGRHREALEVTESVVKLQAGDMNFVYNLICLMSINDRTDEAMEIFGIAVKDRGFYDIAQAMKDPDLAKLRERKSREFKDLTKVRFEWSIDWGVFSDDICVTNRSAFPLTNVTFEARVSSERSPDWKETFTTEVILPGQTHNWNTRIGSRGEKTDGNASLSADQNR